MPIDRLRYFALPESEASIFLLTELERGDRLLSAKTDLLGARAIFCSALMESDEFPADEYTATVQLARARLVRNDASAAQWLLMAEEPQQDVPYPVNRAIEARRMTEDILGLEHDKGIAAFAIPKEQLLNLTRNNPDLADVFAEHGATVSLIGRISAWSMTVPGPTGLFSDSRRLDRLERENARYITGSFGRDQGHGFLSLGNNGYYMTSHAMNGARVEAAIGGAEHTLKVLPWLHRAEAGLRYAARHDRNRENIHQAIRTVGRLSLDVRSSKAARRAIHRHF